MSEQENSPGGSPIHRHEQVASSDGTIGHADDARISAHLDHAHGGEHKVFHELVSDRIHLDVHALAPTEQHPFYLLATAGMSAMPMNVPPTVEKREQWLHAELCMLLPPNWNPSQEAWSDERMYWPVRLLKGLARIPHDFSSWLGWGHSIPNGDPALPYAPDTQLAGAASGRARRSTRPTPTAARSLFATPTCTTRRAGRTCTSAPGGRSSSTTGSRASNYEADIMTGPDDAHEMIFRGNVLVTNASPENTGQIFVLYNDDGRSGVTMSLRIVWNTIIVQGGRDPALVNVRNETLSSATVEIANNVIMGTTRLVQIGEAGMSNWTLSGGTNYLMPGTDEMSLTGNQLGSDPGFADASGADYRPASGSALIGAADLGVAGAPNREYAENESITRRFRPRLAAADIGAFESDTVGGSFGAYDDPMLPPSDAGPPDRDAGAMSADGGATGADAGPPPRPLDGGGSVSRDAGVGSGGDGCGCRAGGAGGADGARLLASMALLALLLVRRRGSGSRL